MLVMWDPSLVKVPSEMKGNFSLPRGVKELMLNVYGHIQWSMGLLIGKRSWNFGRSCLK